MSYEIESIAFEGPKSGPYRGYTIKASYLKAPNDSDALIEISKDGLPWHRFTWPAYKVWNLAAHFNDIVDGDIAGNDSGYHAAAWDGISGATFLVPKDPTETTANTRTHR